MLYVYRASAGSGKTHLLTGFYIELLFRPEKTPSLGGRDLQFDEILAVTFTNKATAEMKERIVEEIFKLSHNPRESDYYRMLCEPDADGHVMSDEVIRKRAKGILSRMLNNYSDLHISTIDSFFQQVIRSFAHELNMNGSYELELNSDRVLDHAVSEFLLGLNKDEDSETFDWMLEFNHGRFTDGSGFDAHADLLKLAGVLTTEAYRSNCEKIKAFTSDNRQMQAYTRMLRETISNWHNDLRELGEKGVRLLQITGIGIEEFAYSGGPFQCFEKLAAGETVQLGSRYTLWAADPANWFGKKSKAGERLSQNDKERLQGALQEVIDHLSGEPYRLMMTAKAIRKNFYQLGLLSKLERAVSDYCDRQGVKLISTTTQLLNALIGREDSPFIYEKTGTRIQSFMIDEFQDTSGMQWDNFQPLLRNSLGDENQNLIVGDVKQSIYRWRGGDWELLNTHLDAFMPWTHANDENGNTLSDNWRSDRQIIEYNNRFFKYASERFMETDKDAPEMKMVAHIYSDVAQHISADRVKMYQEHKHQNDVPDGDVYFDVLTETAGTKAIAEAMERLPEAVIKLQQQGYRPGQILILCRMKRQCQQCAEALLAYKKNHPDTPYGFDIITNEALRLGNRQVIRTIISFLHAIHEPRSEYRRFVAACCWMQAHGFSMGSAIDRYSQTHEFPDIEALQNVPLYEMVERLMGLLPETAQQQNASFLQAFRDAVLEFCTKEGPSLDAFLRWWDEHGVSKSIATPEGQDAIRIMTIHASKGLGEDAVIIPYASWLLDIDTTHPNILWCEPKEEPFGRDGLIVPVEVNSAMRDTIFYREYSEERLRAIIDSLNLAYVAFTRAKHALVIMAPAPSGSKNPTNSLERFLCEFAPGFEGLKSMFGDKEEAATIDRIRTEEPELASATETADTDSEIVTELCALPKPAPDLVIKRTNYAPDEGPVARGNTLHDALSSIRDSSDVEGPVRQLFDSGQAEAKGITLEETLDTIHQMLSRPDVARWFDPRNSVLNERNIVTVTTHTQRPDRVVFTPEGEAIVIDYKTGAEHESKHHDQVAYYMKLLRRMGFTDVKGYIWYIEPHNIVEVVDN